MSENLEFNRRLIEAKEFEAQQRHTRSIDPLAYSTEFEIALLPKITLLQATLDHVAIQLQSTHQRRILTRLEHNTLAMSQLAFERSASFKLNHKERDAIASTFLLSAVRSALQMIVNPSRHVNSLDLVIKRLSNYHNQPEDFKQFRSWDDPQNISDFLDLSSSQELKLQKGLQARKLHYLCQLSVFTSTPKSPDDYPLSVLVTPDEFFSLSTMWARKPRLWSHNAIVTQSGKLIISKANSGSENIFRRNLGLLADLHLELARLIDWR
jgi:hypothetical protein